MSLKSRQELCQSIKERYRRSSRREKKKILDEFTAATGCHRKHSIRVLGRDEREKRGPVRRTRKPRIYTPEVQKALVTVWEAANRICSKRFVPYLPTFVESLERHDRLRLDPDTRARLLSMSSATVDRLLYGVRHNGAARPRSRSSVNPLLKAKIPVRTFDDWTEDGPGFIEADLVCHCGDNAGGSFVNTFVLTDVETGWIECLPLLYKDAEFVIRAFKEARRRFPFPVRGLDTDNGSEFITHKLYDYCLREQITFTRSRPWKKNDQCFVEQKNGHVVRRLIGYDRYEGLAPARSLGELYKVLRLYVNFFQPSMRLLSKSRNGAKTYRLYDEARTPYDRILASDMVSKRIKNNLRREYLGLDPVDLLAEIERLQDELWRYAHREVRLRSTKSNKTPNDLHEHTLVGGDGQEVESGSDARPKNNATLPKRTYRKSKNRKKVVHWWKTCPDTFEAVWEEIKAWLDDTPYIASTVIMERLQAKYPGQYPDHKLRTLQRRVKTWRISQIEHPVTAIGGGDSLPHADAIELVVHCESQSGNESVR